MPSRAGLCFAGGRPGWLAADGLTRGAAFASPWGLYPLRMRDQALQRTPILQALCGSVVHAQEMDSRCN